MIVLALLVAVPPAAADTVRVCYNYGCLSEDDVIYKGEQLAAVHRLLGAAGSADEERAALSLAIGSLLAWAGTQTPIAADLGGNVADQGVAGRMDCIDHSTTTTRLLRMLEARGWLRFHRVLDPVQRVRYVFAVHFSAQIEEFASAGPARVADDGEQTPASPARFVVDSWFRDNGQPAVVMALGDWLDGVDPEDYQGFSVAAGGRRGDPAGAN